MHLNKITNMLDDGRFYRLCFLLINFSLACSLFIVAYPKKITTTVIILIILCLIYKIIRKDFIFDKAAIALSSSFFLIGLVRYVWGLSIADSDYPDIIDNYFHGGKILMLSSVALYFIVAWRGCLTKSTLYYTFIALFLGLLCTTGVSLHEYFETGRRVELITDSAGTVTYLMTAVAFCALLTGYKITSKARNRLIIFILIFFINMGLVFLTASRAGVLTVPFLYLTFFFITHKTSGKFAIAIISLCFVVGALLIPNTVWKRLDNIQVEINTYQVNNNTSIGARFSIWKGTFNSIDWSLLGQKPDERTDKSRKYINAYERGNPEAYKNVKYHAHNDFLDTLALQGIAGAISLLLFYIVVLIVPVLKKSSHLAVLPLSIIIFGLTDTVLIQQLSVLILTSAMIICFSLIESTDRKVQMYSN